MVPSGLLGARNLANGATEIASVAEVDSGDRCDGPGNDLFGIDLHAQREAHENRELGTGVKAADIFSRVGFCVALCLRLGKNGCVLRAFFHFAENEIAGSVENAFDAFDVVTGEALLEAGNDGNSAGDGGAVFEMAALCRCNAFEIDAVKGNEFLVGGDNAFPGFESAAHPDSGRIQSASEFHDRHRHRKRAPHPRLRSTPHRRAPNRHACGLRRD